MDIPHQWKDSRELILTDSRFGHAAVDFTQTNQQIYDYVKVAVATWLFVFPVLMAADSKGITTPLGRGGSVYTAAILAAAVDAKVLEVWTDVSGMMTADPRLVSNVKLIPQISYQEAMELSHFGAKVIYPPTIQPVMRKNIPVWIKNTFSPADPATVIEPEAAHNGSSIRGISSIAKIALLSLEATGTVGIPGISRGPFEATSGL